MRRLHLGLCVVCVATTVLATDPLAWRVEYDGQGRVVTQTDPAGRVTRYTYAALPGGSSCSLTEPASDRPAVTWRFDAKGSLSSLTDGEGSVTYRYDACGRLESVERADAPAIRYGYDSADHMIVMTIGDLYRVAWSYDFLGRLAAMDTPAGRVSYEYVAGSGTVVRSLPNGVKTLWKREPNGVLESITHGFFEKPDSSEYAVLVRYTYTHAPDGKIAAIRELTAQGEGTYAYAYDTMGRLVRAATPDGSATSYTYDLVGNRLGAKAGGTPDQTCVVDWLGRLTAVDGRPTRHDACGNLSELTLGGVARQYSYRPDGRLAEARAGAETTRYRYDGLGRLVARACGSGETRFISDPLSPDWHPLIITAPNGTRTFVIWDNDTPLATLTDGQANWFLGDHLGSVRLTADGKGVIRSRCAYTPFGESASGPDAQPAEPLTFGFAGLPWDGLAAAYLTHARSYVPATGRFLQPDPVKRTPSPDGEDTTLFGYCGGDPVNWTDGNGTRMAPADARLAHTRDSRSEVRYDLAGLSGRHVALTARVRRQQADVRMRQRELIERLMPQAQNVGGRQPRDAELFTDNHPARYPLTIASNRPEVVDLTGMLLPREGLAIRPMRGVTTAADGAMIASISDDFLAGKLVGASAEQVAMAFGDRFLHSADPRPSSVSGIYLGGTGRAITGLGAVRGVFVDDNNNLVLLGEDDSAVNLPPLRLDDLVTVFRSVYLNGEGPTVTIDPNPDDPEKAAMIIRHSAATENTYVGWVLYQADRIMKTFAQGVDNITEKDVVTSIPGYADVLNTVYFGSGDPLGRQKEGVWERFWIIPAEARRFSGSRRKLTLMDIPLRVKTQKMKWEKGKLVDDVTGQSSPGAIAFSGWFTDHFNAIAAEQFLPPPPDMGASAPVPVFAELQRIALMTAIAEKLRDDGVPMPFWMRDYEVGRVSFEHVTPGLEVTKRRQNGTVIETARLFGGVNLSPESKTVKTYTSATDVERAPPETRAAVSRNVKLSTELETTIAKDRSSAPSLPLAVQTVKVADGHPYRAAALPGAETQALAPCRLEVADLDIPVAGGKSVRLTRAFNSFFNPQGPWGRTWSADLPTLREIRIPLNREGNKVSSMTGYELVSPFNDDYACFRDVRPVKDLGGARLQTPTVEGPYYGLADAKPDFLQDASTRVVLAKDGQELHFSTSGDLVAVKEGPQVTVYERQANGSISRIVSLLGKRQAATIELAYDSEGRLKSATGRTAAADESGVQKNVAVTYAYDTSGNLTAVQTPDGQTRYQYEGSKVVAVAHHENLADGKPAAEESVRRFVYHDNGQLVSESDAAGAKAEYRVTSVQAGVTLTVAKPENKTDVFRYDATLRPLEAKQSDGTLVEWRYPAEGGAEVLVSPSEGDPVRLAESADKCRRTVTYGNSDTVAADYDRAGRLTTLTENGQPVLWQEWNPDGSLRLMRTEACATHPEYDENGVVTRLLLAPPDERGTFTHYQETTLDSAGRAREISDYSGLKVFMDYDTGGLLKTLIRKQDGKNYGFEITRDRSGRVETLDSTWGKQHCAYDARGQLERVEVDKQGARLSIELESGTIKRVNQFDGGVWLLAHDRAQAGVTQVQAPNGLKLTYGYDADGRLRDAACGDFRVAYVSDAKQKSSGVTYERRSEARAETPVKLASAVTRGNDTTQKTQVGIPAEEAATPTQADPALWARQWAKIGNTTRASGLDAPLNAKVGEDIVEEAFRSHHNDTIAYRTRNKSLAGDSQGSSESIIKLIPNTGNSPNQVNNGIEIQKFLLKKGIAAPVPLPVFGKEQMVVGDDVLIIREQVAKGEELSKLRDHSPNRTLTEHDADAYVRAMFDIGQKAKDLPDAFANKPAIRNETQMRERLFDRNRLAQLYFFLYSKTPSYAKLAGANYWQTITGFHDAFNDFVNACWKNSPLSEVVYVHDAILSNCFIDKTNPAKPKVSIIDVIDDYVGSAGHLLSITMSQLRPAPGQTWTLAEFRTKLYKLLETYSMSKDVPLTEEQTTEIIQNMAFHPYKFVTSDSKQFIRQLGEECGLPPGASEQALVEALSLPQNIPKLDRLLKDESLHSKYKMEMLQIDHTLEVLSERLTGQTEKLNAIRKLQQIIREALKHDVRVASIKGLGVRPQRASPEIV